MTDPTEAADGDFSADAAGDGSRQQFRSLAQVVDAGVLQFDGDGQMTAVDEDFLSLTGYARGDVLGEQVAAVVSADDWHRIERRLSTQVDGGGQVETFALSVSTVDRGTVPCELRLRPLVEAGEFRGAVGVVRDTSDRSSGGDTDERQELVRTLRDRERRLSRLIDNVPGMVYRCRNERGWPMEFVSDACREVTGHDADALVRGEVNYGADIVHEDDRASLWEAIQADVTDREPFSETYRIVTAEGETRWVRDHGRGIFDADGDLVEIEGIIADVTERKRTERRLREERDMFAAGPAVVFRWEPDQEAGWPVEYVSPNVEEAFGYTPEELTSGAVAYTDLLLEEEVDRITETVAANTVGGTERFSHDPYRLRTSDGDVKWVKDTTKVVRDDDGTVTNYLGYLVDITERKERERELEQYKTIVETINDGVYVVDGDSRFTMVNDTYVEMTGYDRTELLGEHVSMVVDESTVEQAQQVEAAMRDDERDTPTIETELITADGKRLPSEATFALLASSDGVERRVGVARDISDRREYERKLERSNQRLEEFAHAVSHDLQEPLRMVSSYLQLIEQRYADSLDEEGEEFLEFAVDGADRMREMIDGLLQYSRVETRGDPFEAVDLTAVISDVRDDLQVKLAESDAAVSVGSLPRVEGDRNQLRQLFQNLLENAIEYSGDDPPAIKVDAERDGDEWVVAVEDDGIGIDSDRTDRVFRMFERLQRDGDGSGTGIGLALCERIADRHGGDIWVESEAGEGATFFVTLPAVPEASETPA